MEITTTYILWSATIYTVVQMLKKFPKLPMRLIPLLPPLIGILSGALIGPHVLSLPWFIGSFYGIGAAGVSALSYTVIRQTIKGRD